MGLVREIESDAAAERKLTGRQSLGPAAILRRHPHTRPAKIRKSPAPLFHAASKTARQGLREAYGYFLAAFGRQRRGSGLEIAWRIPKWLLSAGPPVRPAVCDRDVVVGDRSRRASSGKDFRSWMTSRAGEVRSKVAETRPAG